MNLTWSGQLLGVLVCIFFLNTSCASIQRGSKSRMQSASPSFDFCQITGEETDPNKPELWGAETIQAQLERLRLEPQMGHSPWAAYTVSYKKMTAERDKSRCEGALVSKDPFMNQLNHLLSDIMTRWYITITRQCLAAGGSAQMELGFCPLMQKIKNDQYDALSAAMATTAVYISSHLAISFAAIAYADEFWNSSPYAETKRGINPWTQVRDARIKRMKSFKPTYDQFNSFLGNSISIVASALKDADMVKGNVLNFASGMSRLVPFRASLFGRIRDDAFLAAIKFVETQPPEHHPMLRQDKSGFTLDYGHYDSSKMSSVEFAKIEDFALRAIVSKTSIAVYKNLLGGKTWDEMMKDSDIKNGLEKE
ncbi:MAG: hypothetical protein NTX25_21570 [Proteobacteria bacterium]|nr:hypothetical protein [Pseudomonadota bacterium]